MNCKFVNVYWDFLNFHRIKKIEIEIRSATQKYQKIQKLNTKWKFIILLSTNNIQFHNKIYFKK